MRLLKTWINKLTFKTKKIKFSADKIGISEEQTVQEMEPVKLTEFLDKADRVRRILNDTLKKEQKIKLLNQLQNFLETVFFVFLSLKKNSSQFDRCCSFSVHETI